MSGHNEFPRPDPALIAELYACIHRLGGSRQAKGPPQHPPLSMGIEALDDALPWGGLPRAGLHEVIAADNGIAAAGFCAALLARLIEAGGSESGIRGNGTLAPGTALWCRRGRGLYGPRLYGPGLALLGIDPARLIIVQGRTDTDLFWTMEEALRSGALVGVLGEIGAAHPTALRRLQLAAESHGTTALLLRPRGTEERSAPTLTRWRVGAASGVPPSPDMPLSPEAEAEAGDPGAPRDVRCRWRVELLRCKSGPAGFSAPRQQAAGVAVNRPAKWPGRCLPGKWLVECDETGRLAVAAELRHRPADPAARARAEA